MSSITESEAISVNDCVENESARPEAPYGGTKRSQEFTTENFKLELTNFPPRYDYHLVKHLIHHHNKLKPHKIRVGNGRAYLAFLSEEDRNKAIAKLNGQEYKGRVLEAKIATARHDPFVTKLKAGTRDEVHRVFTEDDVNDRVCPLWKVDYEEQLKEKDKTLRSILNMSKIIMKFSPSMQRDSPELFEWCKSHIKISCDYDGIVPSPRLSNYRNKCEFNIGRDGTVGFRMGSYRDGSETVVHPPRNCPILSEQMFELADLFENYVKNSGKTKLTAFDHVTHEGHLRQLTIRTNEACESLVIVDFHPQSMTATELDDECTGLVEAFKFVKSVVSLYVNITDKNHMTGNDQTLKLIYGRDHLVELLGVDPDRPLRFRVGPTSFFQVNTKAAELLYKSICEIANLDKNSLVLDVGCGTGTITLSLARQVSHVFGIEIVQTAINDAKINAQENNIGNVTFFCGRAEDLISECLTIMKTRLNEQACKGELIAIVDPPRTGFNNSFIKSLRASPVSKIIYVACDPKANSNLTSLCRPKSKAYQGDPFVPIRAKAFDLFPHTKFCELLIVYERLRGTCTNPSQT